jgi:tetratricopeptide (TPR) repeat protein
MQARLVSGRKRAGSMLHHAMKLALGAVLAAALAEASAADEGILWHRSFEQALSSAQGSRKPLVICAFNGQSAAYLQMVERAFADPKAIAASRQFECFAVDASLRGNADLMQRLRLAPVEDEAGDRHGVYPITLFLDHTGKEQFRRHGYLTAAAFEAQLNKAHRLIQCTQAAAQSPNDARVQRELGRAYMEMDMTKGDPYYEAVTQHLKLAIELDPDNTAGANFDARVDLAIFDTPDTPEESFRKLFQLQTEALGQERRFEIQYYMAVAQCAIGSERLLAAEEALDEGQELSEEQVARILTPYYEAAAQILLPFHTEDRRSPYFGNEWTPQALTLLYQIRPELRENTGA